MLLQRNFHFFKSIQKTAFKRIFVINERSIVFYEEMPKSKEYLSSDNSDSDEVEKPPKRKLKEDKKEKAESSKKPKKSAKEEEKEPTWDIGNNRFVKIREFKGKMYVDIREMYMDNNSGDLKPGKKGISMNAAQWRKFMDNVEEIDQIAKNKF